jgi:hypothetical protein
MPVSQHARQLFCPGCGRRCYKGLKRLVRHYYNQCLGRSGGTAVPRA